MSKTDDAMKELQETINRLERQVAAYKQRDEEHARSKVQDEKLIQFLKGKIEAFEHVLQVKNLPAPELNRAAAPITDADHMRRADRLRFGSYGPCGPFCRGY